MIPPCCGSPWFLPCPSPSLLGSSSSSWSQSSWLPSPARSQLQTGGRILKAASTRPGNSPQEHRVQPVIRAIRCIDVHDRQLYSKRGVETSKFYCLLEYYTTTRQCNDSWNTFRLTLLDSSTGLKGWGERKSLTPKGPIEYTAHLQRLLSAGRQFHSNGQREKQVSVSILKGRFPALFFSWWPLLSTQSVVLVLRKSVYTKTIEQHSDASSPNRLLDVL